MTRRSEKRKTLYPYKSQFEKDFAEVHPELKYEPSKVLYTVEHSYTPDFQINETTFLELKGIFSASDRAKHLYIREQHPELTIYLVFQNPNNKLNRASKTTYWEWATKHGISWATVDTIPQEWFTNANQPRRRKPRGG